MSSLSSSLSSEKEKECLEDNKPTTTSHRCIHVESSLHNSAALKEAQALTVKHSVLNGMGISADWKHKIWLRARKNGPLAQRVSSTTVSYHQGNNTMLLNNTKTLSVV